MIDNPKITKIYEKIVKDKSDWTELDKELLPVVFDNEKLDFDKIEYIVTNCIAFNLDHLSIMSYLLSQLFLADDTKEIEINEKLDDEEKNLISQFKTICDINSLTISNEIEDIKKMFLAMSSDMRVVIIKLFEICYDIASLKLPLSDKQWQFVKQVKEIHMPLAERMGLDKLKLDMNDNVVRLEFPSEYKKLVKEIENRKKENQQQLIITKTKIADMLKELNIKGKIESRIKHISSVFNKLYYKQLSIDQIYDILAVRVIVDTVEECYSVLGKIHGIYKPIAGRVKDYIALPKPNGYQSLHTTILVENQHPLEVQIRTVEMHRNSEFGVYAHWLYKEKKTKKNDFDNRLTWFRQMVENAKNMSNQDFIDTLKSDLYDDVIFVQTPKGRVLEFPKGAIVIDFAYAIHTQVGNTCVGAKINGKLKPLVTKLQNGDIVEILTNIHSKGPSRDWVKYVKTTEAKSKIRTFFKNELKDENIRLGKSMFNQAVQEKGWITTQILTDENIDDVLKRFNFETFDEIYACIGSGSISTQQVINRFQTIISKNEKPKQKLEGVVNLKRNKDGVLVDGDSGMLVHFAGCCNPIEGDDIVGYISRGRGVTIHRDSCPNLNYLERERLIGVQWQVKENATFTASIKVIATKSDNNIGRLTNLITGLKIAIKGFDAKDVGDSFICTLVIDVKNKNELQNAINSIKNMKNVVEVYRSEK